MYHGTRVFLVPWQQKNPPAMQEMQEMQVRSLDWEDPLEEDKATTSSILTWRIPWTEDPGRLQSMGSQCQTWLSDWTHVYICIRGPRFSLAQPLATVVGWAHPRTTFIRIFLLKKLPNIEKQNQLILPHLFLPLNAQHKQAHTHVRNCIKSL